MTGSERLARTLLVAAVALVFPSAGARAQAAPQTPAPAADEKKSETGFLGDLSLSSRNEPIVVRSNQLEFDYQANKVIYRGEVNVQQGDLAIDCKELVVNLARDEQSDSMELRDVTAVGDVVITQGERKATGGKAIFDQQKRQIVLLENPVLHDGPNEVTGDRLVVYLDEGRSVVESSPQKRVSAILYPNSRSGSALDVDGSKRAEASAGAQGAGR
ncbi:MAG TPA: LptA/OstA family protein [Candidatus Binatia bacterium]